MYKKFGPVPLRTSTEDPLEQPRASEQEMEEFIETELREIIPQLPNKGDIAYGRATKGAARGVLTKFFLNSKQWQKAANMAQTIITNGNYGLYPDYHGIFHVENEGNEELPWFFTADPSVPPANNIMNGTQPSFPTRWQYWPKKDFTYNPSWNNWASNYRIREAFYNTFDEDDERLEPFMTEYVDVNGDTIDLLNDYEDNIRAFKYMPTDDAQANFYGNDYPFVRYADILLSRAEALVHLNGVNQESIDLINDVRNRAGLTGNDEISMGDFGSDDELLDHILAERGWEFYYEGKRWEDMKRHGVLIQRAQERGITNAQDHHTRLPIPQSAIDSNPELQGDQNPDY
jgi:hypothetical protein